VADLDPQISKRLHDFRDDLSRYDKIVLVQKHVIHGDCYTLDTNAYFDLKREVACRFDLNPNEIILVGSGKLGFSIAPHKRYRPFSDTSDLDVAVVSPALFNRAWQEVFEFVNDGGWFQQEKEFQKYLLRGWIRPDKLPPSHQCPFAKEWWEFFRELTRSDKYGFKVTGGLYNSLYFLEEVLLESCSASVLSSLTCSSRGSIRGQVRSQTQRLKQA